MRLILMTLPVLLLSCSILSSLFTPQNDNSYPSGWEYPPNSHDGAIVSLLLQKNNIQASVQSVAHTSNELGTVISIQLNGNSNGYPDSIDTFFVPQEICHLESLGQLWLDNLRFKVLFIPATFDTFSNVYDLSLRGNYQTGIPENLSFFPKVAYFYLDSNRLNVLDSININPDVLYLLSLTNNKLSRIPLDIASLTHLVYLYLSNNNIDSLPIEIMSLPMLRTFQVRNNLLCSISDSMSQFIFSFDSTWKSTQRCSGTP